MKANLIKLFFGLILIKISVDVRAQTTSLQGKITFNNLSEPFVNVFIKDLSLGTSSNINGLYFLDGIPEGTSIVQVSAIDSKLRHTRLHLKKE